MKYLGFISLLFLSCQTKKTKMIHETVSNEKTVNSSTISSKGQDAIRMKKENVILHDTTESEQHETKSVNICSVYRTNPKVRNNF
jgi:hypothetical protein